MQFISKSLKETEDFARDFLVKIKPNPKSATILALAGDLGSGKTTFTQFLAKQLGISDYVTSPTFVIEKRYRISPPFQGGVAGGRGGFKTLIHLDCYRLNSPEEMEHLDWEEIVANPANLIIIEWPERIKNLLPENSLTLEFKFINENTREIKY
jgi:tRNA threonylcarbamoyladenosine biosynthesis protein TsaE